MMAAMPRRAASTRRAPLLTAALCATAIAGCGKGGGGGTVTKTPATAVNRSPLALPVEEGGLGYLALAPQPDGDSGNPYWIPRDDPKIVLLVADDPSTSPKPPAAGTTVRAVPQLGAEISLTVGEPARVPYGCDGGTLDGQTLTPAAKAPPVEHGVLWVLPNSPNAASWQPSGIEVAVRELSPEKRVWKVGQLEISLTVKDQRHATFAASAGQGWVMSREVESVLMQGAEDLPVDLTMDVPGMPSITAAYSFTPPTGPTGPLLLVVATPTSEGVQLSTLFYDGTTLSEVPTLQRYLYICAF